MSRFPDLAAPLMLAVLIAARAVAEDPGRPYGYGSPATQAQIAGWDIDVRPDGQGLPRGSGSVEEGEGVYDLQCAACHGTFGEGVGAYPALAGGIGELSDPRPRKTVGSYWRYVSTLWDYIHRAMPFTQPESLSDDEVYAVTAYVLYLNDIVGVDFTLSRENLPSIHLANEAGFVADPRPDTQNERCMSNCRAGAEVTITSEAPLDRGSSTRTGVGAMASAEVVAASKEKAGEGADTDPAEDLIAQGRDIAGDRNRGNCFSCHRAEGADMAGDSGPPLVQMGLRFPDRAALRAQIDDPRQRNPESVMPPYGAHGILTDRELDLVVEYLYSL